MDYQIYKNKVLFLFTIHFYTCKKIGFTCHNISLRTLDKIYGLAGIKLTFFTVVHMVPGFGFVARTVLTAPMFCLLLNSACTVIILVAPISKQARVRQETARRLGRRGKKMTADLNCPEGYSVLRNISNKNWGSGIRKGERC